MRGRSKRDPVKEQFWRKAIARFTTSGLTKAKFCKQEQLSVDLLRYWSEVIVQQDGERRSAEPAQDKITDKTFLPVIVAEHKTTDRLTGTQQMAVAEMVFAGGSVFLFNGITTDTVRAVWIGIREGIE